MDGRVSQWLSDRDQLEVSFQNYLKRRITRRMPRGQNLIDAHIEKADHNLEFSYFLLNQDRFLDWTIVGLYYAVYHASLALLAESGFSSKDHTATLCFLIRNYSEFSEEDINLYYDLAITQEEIQFYTRTRVPHYPVEGLRCPIIRDFTRLEMSCRCLLGCSYHLFETPVVSHRLRHTG